MRQRAGSSGGKVAALGFFLYQRHILLQGRSRHIRPDCESNVEGCELADRRKIGQRVERRCANRMRLQHRAKGRHQQRIAIRRRRLDEQRCRQAAATRAVLDDDRAVEARAHAIGDGARHRVGGGARREAHNQAQRGLGNRCLHRQREKNCETKSCKTMTGKIKNTFAHSVLLFKFRAGGRGRMQL